jgi:hypothetical protein
MTIERVRITPTQITLKDSTNKVVFDTNNQYIRTEPAGNLKLNTQIPALRFTTYSGIVEASNVQGVILGYITSNYITANGQTPTYRFPEFTGSLLIASSTYIEGGGQPLQVILLRLKVFINEILTASNSGTTSGSFPGSRHIIFNPTTGGGATVVPLAEPGNWRWDNVGPGSLIRLGPMYRTSSDGVTAVTDPYTGGTPASEGLCFTVIAFQNQINTLPLTVTP